MPPPRSCISPTWGGGRVWGWGVIHSILEDFVDYPDSVQFLYALGNEIKTAKLGLERIRAVLSRAGRSADGRSAPCMWREPMEKARLAP